MTGYQVDNTIVGDNPEEMMYGTPNPKGMGKEDFDIYSRHSYPMPYELEQLKAVEEKKKKKKEKKTRAYNQELAMMAPFLMYAGAGRLMLSLDGKRRIVKVS